MVLKTNAEKRREQFVKTQSLLQEEDRQENRRDLTSHSEKPQSEKHKIRNKARRAWFQEYMELCKPELYDPNYFATHGEPLYPIDIFKGYAVYLAQSQEGKIAEKPTVSTILATMKNLLAQIERDRRC